MRISKLFHWLYASIMLMPIFAIGVKSLYVAFNPNSKDSYDNQLLKIQRVTTISQLSVDNVYFYTYNENNNATQYNLIYRFDSISFDINAMFPSLPLRNYDGFLTATTGSIWFYSGEEYFQASNVWGTTLTEFYFTYKSQSNAGSTYSINGGNAQLQLRFYTQGTLDDVFYYSVDQISNESLFNWANGTFLAQPLLYITNLFGVPSTSPIITILCYWFAISVIWLVFDVIMYIPLLVHRWLDKGVIE